ncbi:hypothetical protein ACNY67_06465 [Pantoea sp. KXB45]|uniref:hypothetical protein n=2 Tax=unclassified Pantoea TaxID=2630326 RepID=UPI0025FF99ED|nr:hypothetical protein [uncultured Pantoea sp.]
MTIAMVTCYLLMPEMLIWGMNGFEFCFDIALTGCLNSQVSRRKKGIALVKAMKSGLILVSEKINDVMPVCYLPAAGNRALFYVADHLCYSL